MKRAGDVSEIEPLAGDALANFQARAEKAAKGENGAGVGSVLHAIEHNLPDALRDAQKRKAAIVADLMAVCREITRLETHHAIAIAETATTETPND